MVSITFAVPNPGCWGRPRPAGFPHAHTRISNILGHGYKLMAISLGLCLWRFACALAFGDLLVPWPRPRPWRWPWPCPWPWPRHNGLIPYGNGNGNGMVMVSITFAFLNRGLQAHLRPAGFPHAHPRISNILGHGSKLMAINLLAMWLVPWPKPWLGLRPRQWPQAQGRGHGSGPKLAKQ